MMHVLIATVGTRGDVQPYVALALGLVDAGFRVTIATHEEHRGLCEGRGIPFRADGGSMRALLETPLGQAWIESSDSLRRYTKTLSATLEVYWPPILANAEKLFDDVDAVIAHPYALHALHRAEHARLPTVVASLLPVLASRDLPPLFFPNAPRWGWLRYKLQELGLEQISKIAAPLHSPYRVGLGLDPVARNFTHALRTRGVPFLQMYSETLTSTARDWTDDVAVTGFAFLDAEPGFVPSDDLLRFLSADPKPPIYIGFGSMTGRDPAELTRVVLDAVWASGVRAVIGNGWGGTTVGDRDDLFVVDDVPHDWLFPRVRAVVHHGGVGTTAAGLRAGRPTGIAAFFGDQPYWGAMTAKLGAGPRPLLRRQIDADNLAALVRNVDENEGYAAAAQRVGEQLRAEDGVTKAVAFLRERFARPRSRFWT